MSKETTSAPEKQQPPKIEIKAVKHEFTAVERNQIGSDLARAIAGLRGIEAEFDQVKAAYKARQSENEARIDKLSTDIMNGFEMRNEKCVVRYRPKDRKKDFYLDGMATDEYLPVLTEDMTASDFQAELIQAESAFENRSEIDLFPAAGGDFGAMILGSLKGRWYSALRVTVGAHSLNQRLDSEQPSDKTRWGAIRRQAIYLEQWLTEKLGKDSAKGFKDPIEKALNAQKEREQ
jgi:hypothetical protein